MDFHTSSRSTIGVEWELQLIDKKSGDLRQNADTIMDALQKLPQDTSMIHREMLLNTIEIVSQPRSTVRECIADIRNAVNIIEPIADSLGISLASSGSHPFADPSSQLVTPSARYQGLVERTQWWGRQMLIFGTHVHVGVEQREKVLPLLNAMLTRFAHIQALTAASPYWNGEFTGYADNRAMMFQQLPTAGIPQDFQYWEQLEHYTEDLVKTGILAQFNELRWDIRPSPQYGTLEMRMCDAATNFCELATATALIQCLMEYFSRIIDSGQHLPSMPQWFVKDNKWRAARYGLDAVLIIDDAGHQEPVKETLARMADVLLPVAQDLDCVDELRGIEKILDLGAPYQRQFAVTHGEADPMRRIVEYMRAEMSAGVPLSPHHW